MRFAAVVLIGALVLAGCAQRATQVDSTLPDRPASAPPVAPLAVQPPETPAAEAPTPTPSVTVNSASLAPYFEAIKPPIEGVFLSQGQDLSYVKGDVRIHVLTGSHPSALAIGPDGALVSDGWALYWFDPAKGTLRKAEQAPPAYTAAVRGNTCLLATYKNAFRWVPPAAPVELAAPEYVHAVYGVSISPDGRYGVVAYDLDIPGDGPRAGVIWAYDLQTGAIFKWPSYQPTFTYGLWLLGWSERNSIRFMTGKMGFNTGHTWQLPGGNPEGGDGTKYMDIDGGASTSPDGSWVLYRSAIGEVDLQSVKPGSEAIPVYKDNSGLDYPRILLNGNLAFRTRQPAAWWEITRSGAVVRWDEAEALY